MSDGKTTATPAPSPLAGALGLDAGRGVTAARPQPGTVTVMPSKGALSRLQAELATIEQDLAGAAKTLRQAYAKLGGPTVNVAPAAATPRMWEPAGKLGEIEASFEAIKAIAVELNSLAEHAHKLI